MKFSSATIFACLSAAAYAERQEYSFRLDGVDTDILMSHSVDAVDIIDSAFARAVSSIYGTNADSDGVKFVEMIQALSGSTNEDGSDRSLRGSVANESKAERNLKLRKQKEKKKYTNLEKWFGSTSFSKKEETKAPIKSKEPIKSSVSGELILGDFTCRLCDPLEDDYLTFYFGKGKRSLESIAPFAMVEEVFCNILKDEEPAFADITACFIDSVTGPN